MWNLRITFAKFAYRGQKRKFLSLFANNGNTLSYSVPSTDVNKDVLNELRGDETVDEELEKKRNKSRLPEEVIIKYVKKEVPPLISETQYKKASLRIRYGRYGKRCGLNPGIAWPTKQELLEQIEDDKLLDPPLHETIQELRAAKEEKMREQVEYEAEVDQNMEKADSYMQAYLKKIEEKKAAAKALEQKRALLVEEISEFLGYAVDPKDPKFQEALEMKEKEKKKAKKAMKQQESYEKMLAQLAKIAADSKADSKTDATSSDTETNPTAAKSKPDSTADASFNKDKDTGS